MAADPSPIPAVCIPPGAHLRLSDIGDGIRGRHAVGAEEEVTFEQLTAAANTYRDAIAFRSGLKIRLQELPEGQRVTVLSLGASQTEAPTVGAEMPLSRPW